MKLQDYTKRTTGAPATGTYSVGDEIIDSAGAIYRCVTAGTPGVWLSLVVGGGITIYASGIPSNVAGNNGDTYVNTANGFIYGPKAAGAWPTTPRLNTSQVGSTGAVPLVTGMSSSNGINRFAIASGSTNGQALPVASTNGNSDASIVWNTTAAGWRRNTAITAYAYYAPTGYDAFNYSIYASYTSAKATIAELPTGSDTMALSAGGFYGLPAYPMITVSNTGAATININNGYGYYITGSSGTVLAVNDKISISRNNDEVQVIAYSTATSPKIFWRGGWAGDPDPYVQCPAFAFAFSGTSGVQGAWASPSIQWKI
jgi:hypothetical protein